MTKKNIILILLVSCFLTIMAIAVWGKEPEQSSRVPVTGLQIRDENEEVITTINENTAWKEKMITLQREKDFESFVYYFSVEILPENATNVSLDYEVSLGEEFVTLTKIESETQTNIHYFKIEFLEQENCRISFKTNKEDTRKTDYLLFAWEGEIGGGEIEI